jgi:hypothetical protein
VVIASSGGAIPCSSYSTHLDVAVFAWLPTIGNRDEVKFASLLIKDLASLMRSRRCTGAIQITVSDFLSPETKGNLLTELNSPCQHNSQSITVDNFNSSWL